MEWNGSSCEGEVHWCSRQWSGKHSFTKVFISPKRTQSYSGEKNKTKTPLGRQHLKQVVKFPWAGRPLVTMIGRLQMGREGGHTSMWYSSPNSHLNLDYMKASNTYKLRNSADLFPSKYWGHEREKEKTKNLGEAEELLSLCNLLAWLWSWKRKEKHEEEKLLDSKVSGSAGGTALGCDPSTVLSIAVFLWDITEGKLSQGCAGTPDCSTHFSKNLEGEC